jgi:hypothetical protein
VAASHAASVFAWRCGAVCVNAPSSAEVYELEAVLTAEVQELEECSLSSTHLQLSPALGSLETV